MEVLADHLLLEYSEEGSDAADLLPLSSSRRAGDDFLVEKDCAKNDRDDSEESDCSGEEGRYGGLLVGELSYSLKPAFRLHLPEVAPSDSHASKLSQVLKQPWGSSRRVVRGCMRLSVLKFTVHVLYLDVETDTNQFANTVKARLRKILNPLNSGLLDMQLKHKNSAFKEQCQDCEFMTNNLLVKGANSSLPLPVIHKKVQSD